MGLILDKWTSGLPVQAEFAQLPSPQPWSCALGIKSGLYAEWERSHAKPCKTQTSRGLSTGRCVTNPSLALETLAESWAGHVTRANALRGITSQSPGSSHGRLTCCADPDASDLTLKARL
jgi:hypothetical protein